MMIMMNDHYFDIFKHKMHLVWKIFNGTSKVPIRVTSRRVRVALVAVEK